MGSVPAGAPGCVTSARHQLCARAQPGLSFPAGLSSVLCPGLVCTGGEPFLGDPASTTVFSFPLHPGLQLSSDGRLL